MKKLIDRIPKRFRNRYGIAVLVLVSWIIFFDKSDAWTTFKNRRELSRMEEQKDWYRMEIARTKEQLHELSSNKKLLGEVRPGALPDEARERGHLRAGSGEAIVTPLRTGGSNPLFPRYIGP